MRVLDEAEVEGQRQVDGKNQSKVFASEFLLGNICCGEMSMNPVGYLSAMKDYSAGTPVCC